MTPLVVSTLSTPPDQVAPVASSPERSSTSSAPKSVMVPAKAPASFSTAVASVLKSSTWFEPTMLCRMMVALVTTDRVPDPTTLP